MVITGGVGVRVGFDFYLKFPYKRDRHFFRALAGRSK